MMILLGFLIGLAIGSYVTNRVLRAKVGQSINGLKAALKAANKFNEDVRAALEEHSVVVTTSATTEDAKQKALVDFARGVRSETT